MRPVQGGYSEARHFVEVFVSAGFRQPVTYNFGSLLRTRIYCFIGSDFLGIAGATARSGTPPHVFDDVDSTHSGFFVLLLGYFAWRVKAFDVSWHSISRFPPH